MKLWQAMEFMLAGKKIRNKCWTEGCYIYKDNNGNYLTADGEPCCDNIQMPDDGWEIYDERM